MLAVGQVSVGVAAKVLSWETGGRAARIWSSESANSRLRTPSFGRWGGVEFFV